MTAPLVVNVTRGPEVESRHEVDAVIVDGDGNVVESWGDADRSVMPRSSAKPIQAVPLITTGAAAAFDVDEVELALACASHNGESGHVERVLAWLERLSFGPEVLECGSQNPVFEPALIELVSSGGDAGAEHNNCSGKHTGFLTVCRHIDLPAEGYLQPDHPLQRDHITPALEHYCRFDSSAQVPSIDGCGIPVWQVPLVDLARGWSRLAASDPGATLLSAMRSEPWYVAGTDRSSTRFMTDPLKPVAVKAGAEGVYCGVLPEEGVALAVKVRDGAFRAADVAMEHLLVGLGVVASTEHTLSNWAGTSVGTVEVAI